MSNEVKIRLREPGTTTVLFTFGTAPWKIYGEIEGLNKITPILTTTSVSSGYGAVKNMIQIPPRTLSFKAVNVQVKNKQQARDAITSIVKPGVKEYTLDIVYGDKNKILKKCYITDYSISSGNLSDFLRVELTITALDPVFYDNNESTINFSSGRNTVTIGGTAPVLPRVITFNGAVTQSQLILPNGQGIVLHQSALHPVPQSLTLEVEAIVNNEPFNNTVLAYTSFTSDISKLRIDPGVITLTASNCFGSITFSEGVYGL